MDNEIRNYCEQCKFYSALGCQSTLICTNGNKFWAANVQPVKKSKWCPPLMGQGKCDTYCERCHGKIMRNSTGIFEETPYCPHCGADMRGEQNDD